MYEILIIVGIIALISVLIILFSFLIKRIINLILTKCKHVKPKIIIYHRKKDNRKA